MKSRLYAGALAVICSVGASASTYDAVADFSSSNPSGQWAYRMGTTGTSLTPLTVYTANGCNGVQGTSCWQPTSTRLGTPAVQMKNSGGTINAYPTVVFPVGVLLVHPGPAVDTMVTWTAPSFKTYDTSGFLELLDVFPTGVIGDVFDGARQVYTGTLTGPAAQHPNCVGARENFSLVETLAAGATIPFGVDNDGNFLNDSTGFDATISSAPTRVPEPASFLLCCAAALLVCCLRRVSRSGNRANASGGRKRFLHGRKE